VDEEIIEAREEAGRQGRANFQQGRPQFEDPVLA
jgi:hypothetical protein